MREYKFRGKRKDTDEWVTGYFWRMNDERNGNKACITVSNAGADDFINYEVVPETVGQFTGLKDRYSIELYEDDIYRPVHHSIEHFKVMFICGAFVGGKDEQSCAPIAWDADEAGDSHWMIKVGNIHDSPELLNPPKEGVLNMNTDPNAPKEQEAAGAAEEAKAENTANEQATEGTEGEKAAEE